MILNNFFKILSLNARRAERFDKIINIKNFCELYSPHVICFQEIHIQTALKVFSEQYQVFINFHTLQDVGIVTVIKNELKVIDFTMCEEGRIIGIKLPNVQVWNVYAASGSNNKKARETFFRESLPNLMTLWKDQSLHVLQLGDHNCTQRNTDSENVLWQKQHVQPGLKTHMDLFGLKDELLRSRGNNIQGIYSRVTNISKTRIDFILSNTDMCTDFRYIDTDFLNLDHKAAFAEYSFEIQDQSKERIPNHRFYSGWVISKKLENDLVFLEEVKFIYDEIFNMTDSISNKEEVDWTYMWLVGKVQLIEVAKRREFELYKEEKDKKYSLQIFLKAILSKIALGQDRWNDYNKIKKDLLKFDKKGSEEAVDLLKFAHIDDHLYDQQKLKNQKQYLSKGKIGKLFIDGIKYTGTKEVLTGLSKKLTSDLSDFSGIPWNEPVTEEEAFFLRGIKKVILSEDDKKDLLGPVVRDEVSGILNEVDLDSSPGEDGITYRIINNSPSFSSTLVNMLDHIREYKNMGVLENTGIMKLLNKKNSSDE